MQLRKDYSGQEIGCHKVISFAGWTVNKEYPHAQWNVRCRCGNEFVCLTQALKLENCRKCNNKGPRPWKRKRPFEVNYNSLIQRARHPVHITYEQFAEFAKQKECHYCGTEIVWTEYRSRKDGGGAASNLDRMDNSKPYEIGNIAVCCRRCNYAKNTHFTYEEWLQIGNLIRSWAPR
jgi:hypothetical protein